MREFTSPSKLRFFPVLACALFAGSAVLSADWREVAGFNRLKLLAGAELSAAPGEGFSHIEASTTEAPVFTFMPATTSPLFSGILFTNKSASVGTAISDHATHVATNLYGKTTSLIGGDCPVDAYYVNDWLNAKFLNYGMSSYPVVESRDVQNHSWVAYSANVNDTQSTEINRRLDYAINRDGFVCVVGSDNKASITLPQLLCQSYNTISVGRDDGGHSAGLTHLDFVEPLVPENPGRGKPDIVAPSADPEYATSWTTPMVASAAALLYAKLPTSPALTVPDRPRVIKALLLATATKIPTWANTQSRPLDAIYGAGILNINHAYNALRAGGVSASNNTLLKTRGWSAESLSGNSKKNYFFTIPPGAPSTPFCSALTWHRVVTKSGSNTWNFSLANLNLRLYRASGFTLGTLVAQSVSGVDNVELVYQSALAPGSYVLEVENTSTSATPYAVAWHSLPAVTITATQSLAREINLQNGLITVTRTGDTTLPLLVPLTVSGSAVAGSHYLTLPATVTIPATQASTTLQVIPIADSLAQGNRTLSVAVATDFALVSNAAQPAVLTIQDKPFDAWRLVKFTGPELTIPSISAENVDPDGDALPNLVEYALGLNPRTPSLSPVTTNRSGGYLTLTTPRNTALTEDILWSAEATSDFTTWQAATVTTNTATIFTARDAIPTVNAPKRFIRLKVTRP